MKNAFEHQFTGKFVFPSIEEQRVLRHLLNGSDARVGYRISHFVTKVDNKPLTDQIPLF